VIDLLVTSFWSGRAVGAGGSRGAPGGGGILDEVGGVREVDVGEVDVREVEETLYQLYGFDVIADDDLRVCCVCVSV